VYWSRIAVAQGLYQGTGAAVPRIGFRNLDALYEGPFDVLRFALLKLGDVGGASAAEADYARAREARSGGA